MLDIIKKIAYTHRYTGTKNEKDAQNFIIRYIKKSKYKVRLEKIKYVKSENYFKISKLIPIWILWITIVLSGYINNLISILLFFSYIVIKKIYPKIESKIAKDTSFNIIATKNHNKKNRLIICCHYDSSKVMNSKTRRTMNKISILFPFFKLIFYLYALILIFNVFIINLSIIMYSLWLVLSLTSFVGIILLSYCILRLYEDKYSNGADDNASSVAVMLKLLDVIKNIDINLRIDFIFFAAEEKELFGSKNWLQKHFKEIDRDKTYILNLDCIGRGKSFFFNKGIGFLFRKKSNEKLEKIISNSCKELDYTLNYYWGGYNDQIPFIERGLNTCSLSRFDVKRTDLLNKIFFIPLRNDILPSSSWIHTDKDNSNFIKEKYLKEDFKLLLNVIYSFNKNI